MGTRLDGVQPQTRFFARAKPEVFEKMTTVLEQMDYTLSWSSPAQGVIEAYGHLLETEKFGSARQFQITV